MSSPSPQQWLSLVGIIWLQTINGANSDFPVYSSQLKHLLSVSQIQLNNLAFASDAGKLFGWVSGVAAIYLPLWLVLVIGAALGLIGFGVQFLFLVNKITSLSYYHVFILTILSGNGICWINTVCYLICIRNFPSDSGIAVGISTSYVGLTAKVYTVIVDAFFNPLPEQKVKTYLLLNAIAPMLVTIITIPLLRIVETRSQKRSSGGFIMMFVITIATGACAIIGSISSASGKRSAREHMLSLGLLLAAPLVVPVALKFKEGIREINLTEREGRVHDLAIDEVEAGNNVIEVEAGNNVIEVEEKNEGVEGVGSKENQEVEVEEKNEGVEGVGSKENQEVGVSLMVRKMDFWLYFFSYMFSATLGLVFLNNLGQIAESRGISKTSSLVSLSSSFGFFGRFMPSLMDYFLSKHAVPRPASMAALMAPIAGAFIVLLHPSNLALYVSTAVIGTCTGAISSIAVSTTPELFGTKNFGVNHNIVVANIPLGSFLFGYFAALLYQKGSEGSEICMGTGCYRKTFIIWGSVCSIGTLLCTVLYVRRRKSCSETTNNNDNPHRLSYQV